MRDHTGYEPDVFVPFLEGLLTEQHRTYREASLGAGLDPGAVRRLLKTGVRPSQDTCINLALYFHIAPNIVLAKAGYQPRVYFDLSLADASEFAPEVKAVAQELMKIADPALRERVCTAVVRLVGEMFTLAATPAA